MNDRIYFVYGTLRPGGRYWPNVESYVEAYEPARVDGFVMYALPEGYPAASPGEGFIFGDLLFIKSGCEEVASTVFDEIEVYDSADESSSMYLRRVFQAQPLRPKAFKIPASMYVFNRADVLNTKGVLVASGDWREFDASRS